MTTDPHDGPQAGTAVEVAFSIEDPAYPFVSLSKRESCTLELVEMVSRGEDRDVTARIAKPKSTLGRARSAGGTRTQQLVHRLGVDDVEQRG